MSAENALIISSEEISKESYVEFFESLNCHWYSGHKNEAIISDEYTQVGVCLMDQSYIEMFDKDDLQEFESSLGGAPKTFFEVNRTKQNDPYDLYMVVARRMAKKWPIAVCDTRENMVAYSDLL